MEVLLISHWWFSPSNINQFGEFSIDKALPIKAYRTDKWLMMIKKVT